MPMPAPGPSQVAPPKPQWGTQGPGQRPFPNVVMRDLPLAWARCSDRRCGWQGVRRGLEEQRTAAAAGLRLVGEDGEEHPAEEGGRRGGRRIAAAATGTDGFEGGEAEDFRAVAPAVMSFAQGRRR